MAHPNTPAPAGASSRAPSPTAPSRFIILRCLGALIFIEASGFILNASAYAQMAGFFAIGREIATLAGALMFAALAVVALRRPALMNTRAVTAGAVALALVGAVLIGIGLLLRSGLVVLTGLLCRSAASVWATALFSVALCTLSSSRDVLLVAGGGTLLAHIGCAFTPATWPLPVACVALALCVLVPIALTASLAGPSLAAIGQSGTDGGAGLRDIKGFVPLAMLLLCVLLMAVASGYALAFNQQNNAPLVTFAENIIVAAAFVMVLVDKSQKSEDRLFSLVVLLVVAGYLMAPYELASAEGATNALLRAGRDCFGMLLWILLAFIGRRNLFVLLPMVGLVRASSSLGTDIGAFAGHLTNFLTDSSAPLAGMLPSIMVFCFVAFLWLGFRRFSFTEAVSEVKLVTAPDIERLGNRIDSACLVLSKQHGLTPRETEILTLLAKGRDGKFIAEKYVLSYQTVKTHIKHLYAKLGVHSRQELIDLVDRTLADATRAPRPNQEA